MSNENPSGWAEVYEAHVADMLAERELAQLDFHENIKRADLFGASMASFRHAVASAELGDAVEAQVHIFMATVLAEADVQLTADQVADELVDIDLDVPAPAEEVHFAIPDCTNQLVYWEVDANKNWRRYYHGTRLSQEEHKQAEELRDRVAPAIQEAEAAVNVESLDDTERNQSLLNAIEATSEFLFVKSLSDYQRTELLRTMGSMANHLSVSGGFEAVQAAFKAYQYVAVAAITAQGKTMPALTQALRAFETIKEGLYGPLFREEADMYIDMLTRARAFKVAFNSLLPVIRMWDAYRPVFEGSNDWRSTSSRTSRSAQRKARVLKDELTEVSSN